MLAVGGDTFDSDVSCSNTTRISPIIAVYSIITTQVFWMKTDLTKKTTLYVSFSPTGNYLIAMVKNSYH